MVLNDYKPWFEVVSFIPSYVEMRSRVMAFQQLSRGYLARREFKIKLGAVITIQAGFRMVLSKSELKRRKKEVGS